MDYDAVYVKLERLKQFYLHNLADDPNSQLDNEVLNAIQEIWKRYQEERARNE